MKPPASLALDALGIEPGNDGAEGAAGGPFAAYLKLTLRARDLLAL